MQLILSRDTHRAHDIPLESASLRASVPKVKAQRTFQTNIPGHFVGLPRHRKTRVIASNANQNSQGSLGDDKDKALCSWLSQCDAHGFSKGGKLYVGEGKHGRGVFARQTIRPGETVLSISLENVALMDRFQSSHTAVESALDVSSWTWYLRLAAVLLLQVADESSASRAAYVNSLPNDFCNPLRFKASEMREIQFKPLRKEIEGIRELYEDAHVLLGAALPESVGSPASVNWALDTIFSRSFKIQVPDGGAPTDTRILAPGVDLCNHSMEPQLDYNYNPSTGCFELTASELIEADEEVYITYGVYNNDPYLLSYGFVPEDNPHDTCVIFDDLEEALDWHSWRYDSSEGDWPFARECAQTNMKEQSIHADREYSVGRDGTVDSRLLAAFAALEPAEDSEDERMEQAALACMERCVELLESLPTTLQEDLELLGSASLSKAVRVIIQFRMGKKLCLKECAVAEEIFEMIVE
ncbi:hypothetical protein CYMTET_22593 [Cymbomonas tetramitiformis]|uniref:SET domain-containing protein n=1 Tax=Cymbomonas tetramitiformis TaxID=36881 RepID=A0AAE0FZX1_9CHLO|nr:hypothetical protein CYMTET_22593 [Cymbomonas tetramitiformis]